MTRGRIVPWLVAADAGAAALAFAIAFVIRFAILGGTAPWPPVRPYLVAMAVATVLWPLAFSTQRLYRHLHARAAADEAVSVAFACLLAAVVLFGADAYHRLYHLAHVPVAARFQFSRVFIATCIILDVLFTVGLRSLVRHHMESLRRRGEMVRRALVVGAGELGQGVVERMRARPSLGYVAIGFLDDAPEKLRTHVAGVPVLAPTFDLLATVSAERVDVIVLALPWSAHDKSLRILEEAAKEGLGIKVVPDLLQFVAFRAGLEDLDGLPLLDLGDDPLGPWDRAKKRAFDVVVSAAALLLLAPVFALVAVLVKRSSPGPIFYQQERLGLDGLRFRIHKFRTMRTDAERDTGPVFAADNDPRATRHGQWLRRRSLDELPQLWNVLKGEMSLVGPRPERPSFVDEFKETIPRYMLRHKMKSGMTGWAQIHGLRGNTSIEQRLEHDLYYARNWTLALDVKILWLTAVRELLKR